MRLWPFWKYYYDILTINRKQCHVHCVKSFQKLSTSFRKVAVGSPKDKGYWVKLQSVQRTNKLLSLKRTDTQRFYKDFKCIFIANFWNSLRPNLKIDTLAYACDTHVTLFTDENTTHFYINVRWHLIEISPFYKHKDTQNYRA
jgi:hypothetical protein